MDGALRVYFVALLFLYVLCVIAHLVSVVRVKLMYLDEITHDAESSFKCCPMKWRGAT